MLDAFDLRSLRPHPADEQALRWLWNEAEGEAGLKSNLGAQLEHMRLGLGRRARGTQVTEVDDRRLEAADRARRIEQRLARVPREHRRTLEAAYGVGLTRAQEDTWHWLAIGTTYSVALLLLSAQRLRATRAKVANWRSPSTPEQKAAAQAGLSRLRTEAMVALVAAGRAFEATRPARESVD